MSGTSTEALPFGVPMPGYPAAPAWSEAPAETDLAQQQRERRIYQVAAEIAEHIKSVTGWRTQRSGVCIGVWVGPERYRCRRADYDVWVESAVDRHLHKPPVTENWAAEALDLIAALLKGAKDWDADTVNAVADVVRSTGRTVSDEDS